MTEFVETAMRKMCRYPRCGSKLPAPVSNPREAFCARGCHDGFYRKRCLVCEQPMERKTEHQLVCGKRKCRNALQGSFDGGRYHDAPSRTIDHLKTSIKPGINWASNPTRPRFGVSSRLERRSRPISTIAPLSARRKLLLLPTGLMPLIGRRLRLVSVAIVCRTRRLSSRASLTLLRLLVPIWQSLTIHQFRSF